MGRGIAAETTTEPASRYPAYSVTRALSSSLAAVLVFAQAEVDITRRPAFAQCFELCFGHL
jgi:hypothetical protein